jgi:hypothetical protein
MTPEEMAAFDRKMVVLERQTDLLVEIEEIRRDMRSLDDLTPQEYEEYVEAIDLWNDGSDPVTRMLHALQRYSKEFGVTFPWQGDQQDDQQDDQDDQAEEE